MCGGVVRISDHGAIASSIGRLASDVGSGGRCLYSERKRKGECWDMSAGISHLRGVGRTAAKEEASTAIAVAIAILNIVLRSFTEPVRGREDVVRET
jgi:hypothetical protein